MSKVSEKVAYIRGLIDGMGVEDNKLKLLYGAFTDALESIAEELEEHDDELDEMDEKLQEVKDSIDFYDDIMFGDDDDEDDEEDDDFLEVVCPECGESIYFDADMIEKPDSLICPNCNEPIELDFSMDEEEEGKE